MVWLDEVCVSITYSETSEQSAPFWLSSLFFIIGVYFYPLFWLLLSTEINTLFRSHIIILAAFLTIYSLVKLSMCLLILSATILTETIVNINQPELLAINTLSLHKVFFH